MWLIGVANAVVLALVLYGFAQYGFTDRDELPLVSTWLVVSVANLAGLFWLKPREEERLVLAVQMAELRKRLVGLATKVTQAGRSPVSRRTSVVVVAANVIAAIIVLKFSMREEKPGMLIGAIPSVFTALAVYRLWASDDLSELRREVRRAELTAQLKALQ